MSFLAEKSKPLSPCVQIANRVDFSSLTSAFSDSPDMIEVSESALEDVEIALAPQYTASDDFRTDILPDAENLAPGIFPAQLHYMDISFLDMKSKIRIPETVMVRNEWFNVDELLRKRPKGIEGSVLITGQPGIGENQLHP